MELPSIRSSPYVREPIYLLEYSLQFLYLYNRSKSFWENLTRNVSIVFKSDRLSAAFEINSSSIKSVTQSSDEDCRYITVYNRLMEQIPTPQ